MFWKPLICVGLAALAVSRVSIADLGSSHAGTAPSALSWDTVLAQPDSVCKGHEAACSTALGALDSIQSVAVSGLSRVKAGIESQERKRASNLQLAVR